MKQNEIKCLISLGFSPASYFKRSSWMNIQRVMEYLSNRGFIKRTQGEIKYSTLDGKMPTLDELDHWATEYRMSPVVARIEEMKKLSRELSLPLNSGKLLQKYMDIKIS